ncbi:aa3-type cytochrome c oxidase subunit IV [uncultured Cohaesibacter sp.]|nr:aa3-type cytochrome c oxidase subunit IV [uncultured Cohaesibacter sp.]
MADKLNPVMDYDEHNKTYDLFLGLVKYGIAGLVVLLILMAIFLL